MLYGSALCRSCYYKKAIYTEVKQVEDTWEKTTRNRDRRRSSREKRANICTITNIYRRQDENVPQRRIWSLGIRRGHLPPPAN